MKQNKTAASEAVREALTSLSAAIRRRLGEKGAKIVLLVAPLALVAVVLLIAVALLVPVSSIEVSGDVDMFNEGDIVEASGVGEGDRFFLHPFFLVSQSIKDELPLVDSAVVIKNPFTGKVYIDVKVKKLDYYVELDGKYYAIDENLRVLDSSEKRSKYSANGASLVRLPEVRELVVGERIVFYDTVEETDSEGELLYEVKDESYYAYVSEFLSALKDSGFLSQTDGVLLEEKFDVRIVYDLKYQIKFGNSGNLDAKFGALFGILNEGTVVGYKDNVSIDLSLPSMPTARADLTLDFTEFDD